MKTKVFISGIALVCSMVWFAGRLRARADYQEARKPLDALLLRRQIYAAQTLGFIEDVKETWERTSSMLAGPYGELMFKHGFEPTVANYLKLVSDPLPEFPLLWPFADGDLWSLVKLKEDILPRSLDGAAHASSDNTQVMVRFSEALLMILQEETDGLRESMFRNAPPIETNESKTRVLSELSDACGVAP